PQRHYTRGDERRRKHCKKFSASSFLAITPWSPARPARGSSHPRSPPRAVPQPGKLPAPVRRGPGTLGASSAPRLAGCATSRDDDAGTGMIVERDALVHLVDVANAFFAEQIRMRLQEVLSFLVETIGMRLEYFRGPRRHRTVDVDGKIGQLARADELVQEINN